MLTNEARREILDRVKTSGFPGGISEAFKAAEQGVDVISQFEEQQAQQQEMQVAQTQQEQETGLRNEHAAGNTGASMAFPNTAPNQSFNTVGMKAPIDIQKVNDQGHLVESYKNVPPGIQDLPTGPYEGTVIESPAAYQTGGLRKYHEGGTAEQDHMDMMNNGTLDAHNAEGNTGNTGNTDTGMYGDSTGTQETVGETMDWGVSMNGGSPGIKTPYGSFGMLPEKPKSWGDAAGLLMGPAANLTGIAGKAIGAGKGALDKVKSWFEEGGVRGYQKGGLRNHMMNYLHTSGRDTNYVNTVMSSIAQHESKNNATQVQVSGNKTDGYYDGPGRGKYQFEVGDDKGGNTAMNRTANFLKHNTNKNIRNFPALNKLYNADNSLDFTDLNSKDQDALFIGDKIFGGVTRRNSFDVVTRNRTTPPSQEETFKYWLSDHKGKVNGKEISDLTEAEIEVERKKWNSRTKNMFQYGGTKLSTPTNNFTLAKGQRKIQINERDPGVLEDLVTNAGLSFNAATKHSLINTRKLNLQSRLNITPKIGWNSSNKKFSQFGTPSLNLEGSLDLNANYRPTQNTTITAGANFAPNQRPSYTAGINYRFKRGGYVNKYL